MNVNNLNEREIDAQLVARHSRTSGTFWQKRERLQRFLDFEDQKKRRNNSVKELRTRQPEVRTLFIQQTDSDIEEEMLNEERAADILTNLQDERYIWANHENLSLLRRVEDVEEDNVRLNYRLNLLEHRLSSLENSMDSPPPLIPDSNPQWNIESPSTNYTVDTMGAGLLYP